MSAFTMNRSNAVFRLLAPSQSKCCLPNTSGDEGKADEEQDRARTWKPPSGDPAGGRDRGNPTQPWLRVTKMVTFDRQRPRRELWDSVVWRAAGLPRAP